jgi:putative DNA methylase
MIPKECKRLAEVDFPIAVVSKHAAREKSIRHGHPSTLHLWWARRPLAACRAMLMALLLPDPADPHCPEQFKVEARKLLAPIPVALEPDDDGLRSALLKFIGDFSNWDLSNNSLYLETARSLVKAAHGEETPLVVDPFAGGGSIPLEALRLGCDAFASDLNPVACLILKVMLEDIPRWGRQKVKVTRQNGEEVEANGLAEALRIVGKDIKEKAEHELKEFYPDDPDGSKPIAYLWARTVKCESPNCGAEIPLMRSFWLCKKANRKRALRLKIVRPDSGPPCVEFEIFEPKSDKEVREGTVARARATCPCCGAVLPPERVRAQLAEQRGGADVIFEPSPFGRGQGEAIPRRIGGARMLAVVTHNPNIQGRDYRLPTERDYLAVWKAQKRLKEILDAWERGGKKGLCPVPDEPLPKEREKGSSGFRVLLYGMKAFSELFTKRQQIVLHTIAINEINNDLKLPPLYLSKVVRHCNSVCFWHKGSETIAGAFGRQALPMCWDFPEYNPANQFAGGIGDSINDFMEALQYIESLSLKIGQVQAADALKSPLPNDSVSIWFTDPPYYDAIAYSDLSDFFLVWLKRAANMMNFAEDSLQLIDGLSPKDRELIQDPGRKFQGRPKEKIFYESSMALAFIEGQRVLKNEGLGCVVFAHKTTEGWEALLTALIQGGLTITSSWPIVTERGARLLARDTAALNTSVHLVCRPRPHDAPVGDWSNVIKELPSRVGTWMERLQGEGIRGADLVFACIGPALEIYSRYSKVVDAEDREIPLGGDPMAVEPHKRGYLAYVWEAVGRAALEQVLGASEAEARNSASGALEEDARLTALFLWTLQSTNGNGEIKSKKVKGKSAEDEDGEVGEVEDDEVEGTSRGKTKGFSLIFDVVRRFAQPLGIRLPDWEGRIIETEKGVVRLLSVKERTKQLFGDAGAQAVGDQLEERASRNMQLRLFPREAEGSIPKIQGRGGKRSRRFGTDVSDEDLRSRKEATTLDRVHAAMLLQAGGRANALRALLKAEVERGPDFLRLANALSALYPKTSEEKRLVDAMLLAVPR